MHEAAARVNVADTLPGGTARCGTAHDGTLDGDRDVRGFACEVSVGSGTATAPSRVDLDVAGTGVGRRAAAEARFALPSSPPNAFVGGHVLNHRAAAPREVGESNSRSRQGPSGTFDAAELSETVRRRFRRRDQSLISPKRRRRRLCRRQITSEVRRCVETSTAVRAARRARPQGVGAWSSRSTSGREAHPVSVPGSSRGRV